MPSTFWPLFCDAVSDCNQSAPADRKARGASSLGLGPLLYGGLPEDVSGGNALAGDALFNAFFAAAISAILPSRF